MSAPLLSTKLNIPRTGENLVSRPRLSRMLDRGLEPNYRLTLVSAPAGYGKTTLLSSWLATQHAAHDNTVSRRKIVWLSLDQSDNDFTRFLNYLVTALQALAAEIGTGILTSLASRHLPDTRIVATWLINSLNKLDLPFILVLDDYHVLTETAIHEFVTLLIEYQPRCMGLVIATRADPTNLPLARLRARGQLNEIRQGDLSFTSGEMRSFIEEMMHIQLSPDQLKMLEERTEGWAASLQLVALSFRNIPDIATLIRDLSGGHAFIADYLTGEVLAQQPQPVREFMLQTSILDRLCAPLCQAVTQQDDAAAILRHIKTENLFVISLDHRQEWYRYHALFADLLQKRLYQHDSERPAVLHQRASQWYEKEKLMSQAIEHALAGNDYARAIILLESTGETVLQRNETATLIRWVQALPADELADHPLLAVYYGLALMVCGKSTRDAQQALESLRDPDKIKVIAGELSIFNGLLAIMSGDSSAAIQHANTAMQALAPDRTYMRCLAADCLGMAYTMLGDAANAERGFQEVLALSAQSNNVMMTLMALSNLAGLYILRGALRDADTVYHQVIGMAQEMFGEDCPFTGKAYLGLSMLARERNDLDAALTYNEIAIKQLHDFVEIGVAMAYLTKALTQQTQGHLQDAQSSIDIARKLARESTGTPLDDKLVEEAQARLWLAQGNLAQVEDWLQSKDVDDESAIRLLSKVDSRDNPVILINQGVYLLMIRLNLARNKASNALRLIEPLLRTFEHKGHNRRVIGLLILKALGQQQQGMQSEAITTLSAALRLAAPEGYMRTFLDEGQPMAELLYQAGSLDVFPHYTRQLLDAFMREIPGTPGVPMTDHNHIETLSQRELEVLSLIAQGFSNREIAGKLYLSLSTVKGHTANIYGKLQVNKRTQAVAKGRGLGLLPIK